ncbi:MAG: hypothetical protein ABEJ43_11690 [Haloferacaceae archaeon]
MRLSEFVEEWSVDADARRRDLAAEKSYEVLDHVDVEERVAPVEGATHVGRAAPDIFVGRAGYPAVQSGILAPTDPAADASAHRTSGAWYDRGLGIADVLGYRTGLLNGQHRGGVTVHDAWDGFVGTQREVAVASDPVGVELDLASAPDVGVALDDVSAPTGPRATAADARLTENPAVPRPVEKTLEDDDWRAEGAMAYLYRRGFDVYEIETILSAGALGQAENRRLVPTRWSITAVDDTVGRVLHGQIRDAPGVDEVEVFEETYVGNRYWVVLAPGAWEFELVEMKRPGSVWNPAPEGQVGLSSAHEGYEGRTSYVDETAGAYYAARLGVLEHLADRGRQAKALVLREVTDDYWAPVGVWQVRESIRNATESDPVTAETLHGAVGQLADLLPVSESRLRRTSALAAGVQSRVTEF